ncbi:MULTISPECIES: nitrous oxide-stimulated promoter family protein [Calditerrivibrio]|uniref:Nitrous oxide-stimulated promoter family protein n=1 Tax=Calditerrivibrio nitroreducens TaxID=477976 RepID=A0A2J6WPT3_9BACT|nr:MAG: nitrous oxide-stimulated promoter family protein [Calditerrivibrio nitroreducens]
MKKEKRIKKDAKTLRTFIKIYCREYHLKNGIPEDGDGLCRECLELLQYALKRDEKCPLDPKPKCKDCKIHCYKPEMRLKIKEVMKFSGIYLIKRGRIDYIFHYFF